jgi:hypothetical protein
VRRIFVQDSYRRTLCSRLSLAQLNNYIFGSQFAVFTFSTTVLNANPSFGSKSIKRLRSAMGARVSYCLSSSGDTSKTPASFAKISSSGAWIPELIAAAGAQVTETYIDFFTSTIRNRNTRAAYARACWQFFEWCAAHGLELTTVRPFHVAAWIEDFPGSKPTIKQKLAAVRMLYDFLVVRQITRSNPAHSVRGPKYVVKKGKTPVWSREDAKTLLDSIPKDSVSGLRDLALIAAMFYSFARVSAVLKELVSYCAS